MRALIILACLAALAACSPAPEKAGRKPEPGEPTTYLASITVPLGPGERLTEFSFDTWGIDVLAVCHIPPGWRINAGRSASPDGTIAGEASHGVTWISDMKSLEAVVLVGLYVPVQETEQVNGPHTLPATFKGKAVLETADDAREVTLGAANIKLTPADRCPQ